MDICDEVETDMPTEQDMLAEEKMKILLEIISENKKKMKYDMLLDSIQSSPLPEFDLMVLFLSSIFVFVYWYINYWPLDWPLHEERKKET